MLELLDKIENRYQAVTQELTLPEVLRNQDKLKSLSREHRRLADIHRIGEKYRKLIDDIA